MKTCPKCESRCFDDMNICYVCLYKFTQNNEDTNKIDKKLNYSDNNILKMENKQINKSNSKTKISNKNNTNESKTNQKHILECENMHIHNLHVKNVDICKDFHIPEYFEIESFPYIEDSSLNDEDKENFINNDSYKNTIKNFKILKDSKNSEEVKISFTINKNAILKELEHNE